MVKLMVILVEKGGLFIPLMGLIEIIAFQDSLKFDICFGLQLSLFFVSESIFVRGDIDIELNPLSLSLKTFT